MALAAVGFTSCEADEDPKFQEPTEFVLNTPPFSQQLYQLSPEGILQLTCSQPNYGFTAAPTYNVEVSFRQDFGEGLPEPQPDEDGNITPYSVVISPVNPQSAVLELNERTVSEAMCAMRGIFKKDQWVDIDPCPLYVRVVAQIAEQLSSRIVSNTVELPQVLGFLALPNEAPNVLYTPGNSNGWNQEASQWLQEFDTDKYRGMIFINGEFKFTNQPNWDGVNYGYMDGSASADGLEGELNIDGGAGNIAMPAAGEGLYYAVVDLSNEDKLTYKLTKVESIAVCGSATPDNWDPGTAPAMTPSADFLTWTYTGTFNDGEFKFVINRGWEINYGGDSLDELAQDGNNLSITAGDHTVVLKFAQVPYSANIE